MEKHLKSKTPQSKKLQAGKKKAQLVLMQVERDRFSKTCYFCTIYVAHNSTIRMVKKSSPENP